jgi:CRISPR/Cas system-associated endonuclease/helicase Cas3
VLQQSSTFIACTTNKNEHQATLFQLEQLFVIRFPKKIKKKIERKVGANFTQYNDTKLQHSNSLSSCTALNAPESQKQQLPSGFIILS